MRSIWLALSVLAVANVLALLAFFGWLRATDRLDGARFEQVRAIFAPTVAQVKAEAQKKTAQAEADAKIAAEKARLAKPGVTTDDELQARFDATEIDRQRRQRIHDEIGQLQKILGEKIDQLDRLNAQIAQAKVEFESMTRSARQQATDQQFKKTLSVLEGLKPAPATTLLRQTIDASAAGKDLTVSYLNAMEEETRTNILQEWTKTDPKVAAELLDRLRTRGLPPPAPGEPAK